jgi:hypothetical protein
VLLGTWPADRTSFGASTAYQEQGIQLRLGTKAERLDLDQRASRFICVADMSWVGYTSSGRWTTR